MVSGDLSSINESLAWSFTTLCCNRQRQRKDWKRITKGRGFCQTTRSSRAGRTGAFAPHPLPQIFTDQLTSYSIKEKGDRLCPSKLLFVPPDFQTFHWLWVVVDDGGRKKPKGICRGVVPGGAGGAMAPPDFGRSVNSISTRGQIMPTYLLLEPPDFQTFRRPCSVIG